MTKTSYEMYTASSARDVNALQVCGCTGGEGLWHGYHDEFLTQFELVFSKGVPWTICQKEQAVCFSQLHDRHHPVPTSPTVLPKIGLS